MHLSLLVSCLPYNPQLFCEILPRIGGTLCKPEVRIVVSLTSIFSLKLFTTLSKYMLKASLTTNNPPIFAMISYDEI